MQIPESHPSICRAEEFQHVIEIRKGEDIERTKETKGKKMK